MATAWLKARTPTHEQCVRRAGVRTETVRNSHLAYNAVAIAVAGGGDG